MALGKQIFIAFFVYFVSKRVCSKLFLYVFVPTPDCNKEYKFILYFSARYSCYLFMQICEIPH